MLLTDDVPRLHCFKQSRLARKQREREDPNSDNGRRLGRENGKHNAISGVVLTTFKSGLGSGFFIMKCKNFKETEGSEGLSQIWIPCPPTAELVPIKHMLKLSACSHM